MNPIALASHLFDREISHRRYQVERNATGGLTEQLVEIGTVYGRITQASSSERALARTAVGPQQGQGELDANIYVEPDSDVDRGDRLVDAITGQSYRVVAVSRPSGPDSYLRADCALDQPERLDTSES